MGAVLLVPDWFGRPDEARWLVGLAIVTAAIVRSVVVPDPAALWVGFGCLIVGDLVGILLIGAALRLLAPPPVDG